MKRLRLILWVIGFVLYLIIALALLGCGDLSAHAPDTAARSRAPEVERYIEEGRWPALEHSDPVVRCSRHIPIKDAYVMDSSFMLPNGLEGRLIAARRVDGTVLVIAEWFVVSSGRRAAYPLFYLVDLDVDGQFDVTYIDAGPGGRCEDIQPYDARPGFDSPSHGRL